MNESMALISDERLITRKFEHLESNVSTRCKVVACQMKSS